MATAAVQSGTPGTAVAKIDGRRGLIALLESEDAKKRIVPQLPQGITLERILAEAALAASDNPAILDCTPASIVRAVARAVGWGLTIGETVHLVPFKKKVGDVYESRLQALQDYKGKIELIVAAGGARSIGAGVRRENDPWQYEQGSHPFLKHDDSLPPSKRGAIVGAYAIAHHGFHHVPTIKYLSLEEIDKVRTDHSKQWKNGACPPWYAIKTCVHQLAKLLPKNPRLARVVQALDVEEVDDDAEPAAPAPAEAVSGEREPGDDEFLGATDEN